MALASAESTGQNILQLFYAKLATSGERLLHIKKAGNTFHRVSVRQAVLEISQCVRALYANDIASEARITFHANPDYRLWVAEWAVLASRCIPVIVPTNFQLGELLNVLLESKSTIAIVDRIEVAQSIANSAAQIPDLKRIICFEGSAEADLPILSWDVFIESGSEVADRTGAILRSITPKDTALLFYYKDDKDALQAMRYTHGLLLEHTNKIDELLGNTATIHQGEMVVTLASWEHVIGHIASCYLPILKEAAMQITDGKLKAGTFESRPHVIIGKGLDFDVLKYNITEHVKQQGPGARKELDMALALGKIKYESGKLNPWQRLGYMLLRQTIFKEVQEYLGGRLRLYISVDDTVRYETQLFFETFGIELVELPPEILKL